MPVGVESGTISCPGECQVVQNLASGWAGSVKWVIMQTDQIQGQWHQLSQYSVWGLCIHRRKVSHDSRASSRDGALGRRRFLRCLGGKLLLCPGRFGCPCVLGRRDSQLGMSIGSVPRKAKRAGRDSGLGRVKNLWSFRNVTDSGYPQQYVASLRRARSRRGSSIACLWRVTRERSGSIFMVAPSSSGSSASLCAGFALSVHSGVICKLHPAVCRFRAQCPMDPIYHHSVW